MFEKTSFLSVTESAGSSFPVPVFPTKEKAEEYLRNMHMSKPEKGKNFYLKICTKYIVLS